MYCIYCKKEVNGKFCAVCGHKNISSEKEWKHWEQVYSEYSKERLEDIINKESEYQEDAYSAARYLCDNYVEEPIDEESSTDQEQEKEWFYSFKGERMGPISTAELLAMYEKETINDACAVWKEGYSDWVRLDKAGIVMPKSSKRATPPPVAAKNMNNKAIIFLLFVPIISTLIQYIIAGIFYINPSELWWLAYGLNTVCCVIDDYRVRRAGYNTSRLMTAFVFLIPLYIYKRMEIVKGKKWLATIIWIVIFVADLFIPNVFWVKVVGASNPAIITQVQEGSFRDLPDVQLKKLFNNTIDNCKWETSVGPDRSVYVSVKGYFEDEKIEIVFELDMDNSFRATSLRWGGKNYKKSQIGIVLNYILEDY